jgi:hypothetical protein
MSARLWAEYRAYLETLLPARGEASPEAMRRMTEASDWTRKVYAAEQALLTAEHGTPGVVGSHGEYQWVTMVEPNISAFLRLCPEVVLDKYLAVTRIDGGTLQLSDQEKSDGWWTADAGRVFQGTSWGSPKYRDDWKVAYSPRIASIHGLPNETHNECCTGYDEWYVFKHKVEAGEIEAFVNWMGFRLYDPDYQWCADRLWKQMGRLAPESYIADGTVFTFATRNSAPFASVIAAFSAAPR